MGYSADLCTGGTAISGGYYSTYVPANAFDNNNTSRFDSSQTAATVTDAWIGYDFGAATTHHIQQMRFRTWSNASYNVSSVKASYSDDGTNWTDYQTIAVATTVSTWITLTLNATATHRYWRIRANAALGAIYRWRVSEVEMMTFDPNAVVAAVPVTTTVRALVPWIGPVPLYVGQGDATAHTTAGLIVDFHAAKATGTGPGTNSPATTSWRNLSGSESLGLTGFGWITTSGWAGSGTEEDPYRLYFGDADDVAALSGTTLGADGAISCTFDILLTIADLPTSDLHGFNVWSRGPETIFVSEILAIQTFGGANYIGLALDNDTVNAGVVFNNKLQAGKNHHILTLNYATGEAALYANRFSDVTNYTEEEIPGGPYGVGDVSIGMDSYYTFPGVQVTAIRKYNRILTEGEIQQNFAAGFAWVEPPGTYITAVTATANTAAVAPGVSVTRNAEVLAVVFVSTSTAPAPSLYVSPAYYVGQGNTTEHANAGLIFDLHAARAKNGTAPGTNSPATSQWEELAFDNYVGLMEFDFTVTDGWKGSGVYGDPYRCLVGAGSRVSASNTYLEEPDEVYGTNVGTNNYTWEFIFFAPSADVVGAYVNLFDTTGFDPSFENIKIDVPAQGVVRLTCNKGVMTGNSATFGSGLDFSPGYAHLFITFNNTTGAWAFYLNSATAAQTGAYPYTGSTSDTDGFAMFADFPRSGNKVMAEIAVIRRYNRILTGAEIEQNLRTYGVWSDRYISCTVSATTATISSAAVVPVPRVIATVGAVTATASKAAIIPSIHVSVTVAVTTATISSAAVVPVPRVIATVGAATATASKAAIIPGVRIGITVAPPIANITSAACPPLLGITFMAVIADSVSAAVAPQIETEAAVTAVSSVSFIDAIAPSVLVITGIHAVTANVVASAMAPVLSTDSELQSPVAASAAITPAPGVSTDLILQNPAATVFTISMAPVLSIGSTPQSPASTAVTVLPAPVLRTDLLFQSPASTAFSGFSAPTLTIEQFLQSLVACTLAYAPVPWVSPGAYSFYSYTMDDF
jgi:hypothetical protein